jgi:hypothetical protein
MHEQCMSCMGTSRAVTEATARCASEATLCTTNTMLV